MEKESARSGKRLQSNRRAAPGVSSAIKTAAASVKRAAPRAVGAPAKKERAETKPPRTSAADSVVQGWWEKIRTKCTWMRRRCERIICEVRRHNFPESDRLPVQLALFLWNLIPMLASRLHEMLGGRRRQALRKAATGLAHVEQRRRLHPVAFMMTGCVVLAVMVVANSAASEYKAAAPNRSPGWRVLTESSPLVTCNSPSSTTPRQRLKWVGS